MNRLMIYSASLAFVLLTGCTQKQAEIDVSDTTQTQQSVQQNSQNDSNNLNVSSVNTPDVVETDLSNNGLNSSGVDSSTNNSNDSIVEDDSSEIQIANLEDKLKTIYFDFDRFDLKSTQQETLLSNSQKIKSNESKIKLEGNCDEWGTSEYNMALGLKRTLSVKNALINDGVTPDRISMVSFGEGNPVCTDKTSDCWSKNRRVDFKVLP